MTAERYEVQAGADGFTVCDTATGLPALLGGHALEGLPADAAAAFAATLNQRRVIYFRKPVV